MTLAPKASRPHMPGYGLLPENEGAGLKPWSHAEERLARARSYWVATTRPDGRPHVVPVWAVWLDDRLLFSTGAESRKAKNLAHIPFISVGVEPGDDAIVLEGRCAVVSDPELSARFAAAYAKKYGWDMEGFSEPIYAVEPAKAFAFASSPDEFAGGATRWTFE
jgi:nitroimidazol reductase NimA-like FMN-containing flavoprotein (pyridoxamine 5'-phosphate oxidase superfamily)